MDGEFDFNKVGAEFISHNLDRLFASGTGLVRSAKEALRLRLKTTYGSYITSLLSKFSKTKSFLLRQDSAPLYNVYVPLDVECRGGNLLAAGVKEITRASSRMVITGSGGCGKSMLMKHLVLNSLTSQYKLPVFLELRQLGSDETLASSITTNLKHHGLELDDAFIGKAITEGYFVILLDGFDEVAVEQRDAVAARIREFAESCSATPIILSSRPDGTFDGWVGFTVAKVAPLDVNKAHELISKVPYESDVKEKFLSELRQGLFEKHLEFLSNPLLLSIMLLTYGQSGYYPAKT